MFNSVDFMKTCEILLLLVKSCWTSRDMVDFMKSTKFQLKFTSFQISFDIAFPCTLWKARVFLELSDLKGFMHEILGNLVDFMKSSRFQAWNLSISNWNGIQSEIHNEILLISVKSCEMLWISWNLVHFSEILVAVMKFAMKLIMKSLWFNMKFAVKSIMKTTVKSVMKLTLKSINDIHSEICNKICSEICNEFNEIL